MFSDVITKPLDIIGVSLVSMEGRGMMLYVCALLCVMWVQGQNAPGGQIGITYNIVEELQPQSVIGNVAMDAALDEKYGAENLGSLEFTLLSRDQQFRQYFTIHNSSGLLLSKTVIDRDALCASRPSCDILLDVGVLHARSFDIIKVKINIIDLNDNAPRFPQEAMVLSISESAMPGFAFVIPTASDPDSGKYGVQTYEFHDTSGKFELKVNNNSGDIDIRLLLKEQVDREDKALYSMQVVAHDGGLPPLSGLLNIDVTVRDANDNTPQFLYEPYEISVKESVGSGSVLLQVSAADQDDGPNGEVRYHFTPQTLNDYGDVFAINSTTGEISLRSELDYEHLAMYQLFVTAQDLGPDAMPSHTKVKVIVQDVNDHAPNIKLNALTSTGNVEIPENSQVNTFVAHFSVDDQDSEENGQVTCSLSDPHFKLERMALTDYKITTSSVFDREKRSQYMITLNCRDQGKPQPMSATMAISITVTDENDHSPVFDINSYEASLKENNRVDLPVLTVAATDLDEGANGEIVYSIQGGSDLLRVDPSSGLISTKGSFDYELAPNYDIVVIASDQGNPPHSTSAKVSLIIEDLNDEAPIFMRNSYTFATYENQPVPTEIGVVSAVDADAEPFNTILYSLDPTHGATDIFSINAHSGQIVTKKFLDRETQSSYSVVAVASNPGVSAPSSSATIIVHIADVNDNAPQIEFPNRVNKSVHIPRSAPKGFVFTRINATDADSGQNARLAYSFAKGNEEGLFNIDESTGVVSLRVDLDEAKERSFILMVMVKDGGDNPKTAVADFEIVVNATLATYPASRKRPMVVGIPSGELSTQNTNIVIGLAVATVILVTILIIAIILVKRNQNKREREEYYTCEIQNSPKNSGSDSEGGKGGDCPPRNGDITGGIFNTSRDSETRGSKKGVKFNMDHSCDKSQEQNDLNTSMGSRPREHAQGKELTAHQMAAAQCSVPQYQIARVHPLPTSSSLVQPKPGNVPRHRLDPNDVMSRPWALTQRELEVHQMLQMLMQEPDSDSTSGCSAEGSNTDSGRGPSEDGDFTTVKPHYAPEHRLSPILDDPNSDQGSSSTDQPACAKSVSSAPGQRVKPVPPPRGQYGTQRNMQSPQHKGVGVVSIQKPLPNQAGRTGPMSSFKGGYEPPRNSQRPNGCSHGQYSGRNKGPVAPPGGSESVAPSSVTLPLQSFSSCSDKNRDDLSDCTTTSGSINLDNEYQRHQALRGPYSGYVDSVV